MIKIELNALTRGGSTTRKYFLKKFDVYLRSHFKDLSDVHHEKRGRSHWYALKGIHGSFFFGAYFGAKTDPKTRPKMEPIFDPIFDRKRVPRASPCSSLWEGPASLPTIF
jgi:hypothetical protein